MSAYSCDCGWGGSTQRAFIGHLAVAHDLRVRMPPPVAVADAPERCGFMGYCVRPKGHSGTHLKVRLPEDDK